MQSLACQNCWCPKKYYSQSDSIIPAINVMIKALLWWALVAVSELVHLDTFIHLVPNWNNTAVKDGICLEPLPGLPVFVSCFESACSHLEGEKKKGWNLKQCTFIATYR